MHRFVSIVARRPSLRSRAQPSAAWAGAGVPSLPSLRKLRVARFSPVLPNDTQRQHFHTRKQHPARHTSNEAMGVHRGLADHSLTAQDPILLSRLQEEFVLPLFVDSERPRLALRWMNVLQALSIEDHIPGRPTLLVVDPFLRNHTRILVPALMNWVQSEVELRELAVIAVQTVDEDVLKAQSTERATDEFEQFVVDMRQHILQLNFAKPVVISSSGIEDVFREQEGLSQARFILLDHTGTTSRYFTSFDQLRNELLESVESISQQCAQDAGERSTAKAMEQETDKRIASKEGFEPSRGIDYEDIELSVDDFYYENPYLRRLDFIKSRVFTRTEWQAANQPLERLMQPHTLLRFPSFITSNTHDSTLLLSDSHHNRIFVLDRVGRILECVGSGKYNQESDGDLEFGGISFQDANLARPNGICVLNHPSCSSLSNNNGRVVYFADTGTNSIKCIDLLTKQVSLLFDLQFADSPAENLPYRDRLYMALKKKFIYPNYRMSSTFHMDEVIAAKADLEFEMERLDKAAAPIPLLCESEEQRIKRPLDVFLHYENDDTMTMFIVDESYERLWKISGFYNHIVQPTKKRRTLRLERVDPKDVHDMDGYSLFETQYLSNVLDGHQIANIAPMLPKENVLMEYLFLKHFVAATSATSSPDRNTYHFCPLDPQCLVAVKVDNDDTVTVMGSRMRRGLSNGSLPVPFRESTSSSASTPGSLNHPISATVLDGRLYVADTYNHLIRTVDLHNGSCRTFGLQGLKTLGFPSMEYRPYLSSHLELKNITYGMERTVTPENFNPHLDNSMLGYGRVVQIPLEMSLGLDLISVHIHVPPGGDYEFVCPLDTFNVSSVGPWIHFREAPQLLFLKWKTNPPGVPSIKYPRPLAYAFRPEEFYDLLYPNNAANSTANTINIPFLASGIIGVGEFVVDAVTFLRRKRNPNNWDSDGDESADGNCGKRLPAVSKFSRAPFYASVTVRSEMGTLEQNANSNCTAADIVAKIQLPIDAKYFHKNLQTRHVHKWGRGEAIVPQVMEIEELEQVLMDQDEHNGEWNPSFFRNAQRPHFEHHEDQVIVDYIQIRLGVSTDGGQEHRFPIKTRVSVETNVSKPPVFVRNDFKRQHISVPESWPEDPCLQLDSEEYIRDPEMIKSIADIGAYTGLISPYPDDKLAEAIDDEDFLAIRAGQN